MMRTVKSALLVLALVSAAGAQSPEPPLSDTRLTVHTLVREDIFAGFMANDMNRFSRAERNLEVLLDQRPAERAPLIAWKGSTTLYRAVLALESGRTEEFERLFQAASDAFADAARLESGSQGVAAVIGGTMSVFADRLPERQRSAAWSQAYESYAQLWKEQGAIIDKLPVHHRGELLGGLAQSAQRTGRPEMAVEYVDRMIVALEDTPYEATAKQWKADPASAAGTSLTCKNCHTPGRLVARLAALKQ